MSKYTKALTAEQLIQYIANDRPELSHEKVKWQRDDYIKICREWLEENLQRKLAVDFCLTMIEYGRPQ